MHAGKSIAPNLSGEVQDDPLPSAALASGGGGDIAADSPADDAADHEPVVWLDISLPISVATASAGDMDMFQLHGGATLFERVLRRAPTAAATLRSGAL